MRTNTNVAYFGYEAIKDSGLPAWNAAYDSAPMYLFNATGSAVRNSPAELAFDIDYLDDYEYAIGQLKQVAKA